MISHDKVSDELQYMSYNEEKHFIEELIDV